MKPAQTKASSEMNQSVAPCLEVMILWGSSVLHVEHLSPPRSFSIGGERSRRARAEGHARIAAPELGDARVPVVIARDDGTLALVLPLNVTGWVEIAGVRHDAREVAAGGEPSASLDGAREIAFPLGSRAQVEAFGLVFCVSSSASAASPAKRWHFDKKHLPFVIGSALLQLGALGTLSNFSAPPRDPAEPTAEQIQFIRMALQTVAEKEMEAREAEHIAEASADQKEGGTGTRAKGEEGSTGAARQRFGVQGPRDSADPHIARQAALRDANEFGMIGLLNSGSGGDPGAPTAPWGRDDGLGNDPLSARGNLWGVGEGGGGLGTFGHGAGAGSGQGFGAGAGRLGGSHRIAGGRAHKVASPRPAAPRAIEAAAEPAPRAPVEAAIDPNGRFATTYRPGGGHLAAFESAVARGIVPAATREVVSDVGARYAPSVEVPSGKALGLRVDLERGKLAPGGGPFHLRLALRGSAVAPAARPHLSVHLVLDVSGSMSGESIARARDAAVTLVDRLAPTDDFSLTTFSSDASVRVSDGLVGPRREDIKRVIASIGVQGGTNIGDGLSLGYAQAATPSIPADAVRVVLLLSDGKANEGITGVDRLSRLSLDAFQRGVQTSALGLGADYDGALMSSIASDGAGGYYYLRSPDQIAPALATELDKRLDPVATAVEVRVRLKKDVSLLRVYGSRRLNDAEAARVRAVEVAADRHAQGRDHIKQNRHEDAEGGMRFFFPAFARDDSHALLLKLALPAGAAGKQVALVELKYKDRLGKRNVIEEIPVEATYADSDAASGATIDPSVARTVQGFAAGEALIEAAARIAGGDRGGAVALLAEREAILHRAAETLREPLFLRDAARLARLRGEAEHDSGLGEPLVLSMLLETAGRAHLR